MIHASCRIPLLPRGEDPVLVLSNLLGTFSEFGLVGDILDLLGLLFGVLGPGLDLFGLHFGVLGPGLRPVFLVPVSFERQTVPVV